MEKLGLVCMRKGQGFKKGFTGLKAIKKATQSDINERLLKATLFNLEQTYDNISYCYENDIATYRVSSEIIPFYEFWNWENYSQVMRGLTQIYNLAADTNITLITHPDAYTVINSPDHNIVANSIKMLEHHYKLANYMNIQHIIIHTGGVYGDKDEAITRFVENYLSLDKELQNLLCTENCHSYNSNDIKLISDLCGINTAYDLHHERVINGEICASTHTLNINKLNPVLCHISSGKTSPTDKSHSDYISNDDVKLFQEVFNNFPDMIVEVEAKAKELAIDMLIKNNKEMI